MSIITKPRASSPTLNHDSQMAVTQLRKVRLTRTPKSAIVVLDHDCCDDCDETHLPGCGFALAMQLLPRHAEMVRRSCAAQSREVQTYEW